MNRLHRGFTLIELLVVITIIGILMALIVPAVSTVREYGRQTTCLNNQKQIGLAIIGYEGRKNHLPGVINQTALTPTTPLGVKYSWVEAILPNLDRMDLWELVAAGKAAGSTIRLDVVICPNDPYWVNPTSANAQALLSYGVNNGYFLDYTKSPPVNISGTAVAPAILSKLKNQAGANVTPSATVMLGEQTGDSSGTAHTAGKWTDTGFGTLSFADPGPPPFSGLSSNHPGIIVVVYFDGSAAGGPNQLKDPEVASDLRASLRVLSGMESIAGRSALCWHL